MLPEIGGLEWLVIAVVALVVIGPKDLPVMMRRLGQFTAKLRGMAAEFRSSFDEMARQSELDDLRKEVEAMRRGQFGAIGDVGGEMRSAVSEIESSLGDVGVQLNPPASYAYDAPQPPLEISEAPAGAPEPAKTPSTRRKPAAAAKASPKSPKAAKSSKSAKSPRTVKRATPAAAASKPAARKASTAKASARKTAGKTSGTVDGASEAASRPRRRSAGIVEGGA